MNSGFKWSFLVFSCFIGTVCTGEENAHLSNLLDAVKNALYSGASLDNLSRRPEDFYYSHSNGISLGVYEALLSITRNDDLECIPRLLCEAVAGGQPGFSGRDIKFDKDSLTKFVSYLNLGATNSSPFLTFAKAALLGASNRGDPYTCIINYFKCPKDQSRLLYYLNNHRGGFFQYFDKKEFKTGDKYSQNSHQYRPGYNYYITSPAKYKKNKVKFENTNLFLKKKVPSTSTYAQKYKYSFRFPNTINRYPKSDDLNFTYNHKNKNEEIKRMVFPEGINPRIRNEPATPSSHENFFIGSNRFPKKEKNSFFFPEKRDESTGQSPDVSDRLPFNVNFPSSDLDSSIKFSKAGNGFFPSN